MSNENERVQAIIDLALAAHCDLAGALRSVRARRRAAGRSDDALSAAEHYLFARHAARTAGLTPAQVEAMLLGYDAVHGLARLFRGVERITGSPAPPPPPASLLLMRWGLRGAAHGRADRARAQALEPDADGFACPATA